MLEVAIACWLIASAVCLTAVALEQLLSAPERGDKSTSIVYEAEDDESFQVMLDRFFKSKRIDAFLTSTAPGSLRWTGYATAAGDGHPALRTVVDADKRRMVFHVDPAKMNGAHLVRFAEAMAASAHAVALPSAQLVRGAVAACVHMREVLAFASSPIKPARRSGDVRHYRVDRAIHVDEVPEGVSKRFYMAWVALCDGCTLLGLERATVAISVIFEDHYWRHGNVGAVVVEFDIKRTTPRDLQNEALRLQWQAAATNCLASTGAGALFMRTAFKQHVDIVYEALGVHDDLPHAALVLPSLQPREQLRVGAYSRTHSDDEMHATIAFTTARLDVRMADGMQRVRV